MSAVTYCTEAHCTVVRSTVAYCTVAYCTVKHCTLSHWCLKSIKSGFPIAIVTSLKNLDFLSQRIEAKKFTHGTLQDTKENV